MDNHSSLLRKLLNYKRKNLLRFAPERTCEKTLGELERLENGGDRPLARKSRAFRVTGRKPDRIEVADAVNLVLSSTSQKVYSVVTDVPGK